VEFEAVFKVEGLVSREPKFLSPAVLVAVVVGIVFHIRVFIVSVEF
jgi:hypothetical protein